MVNSDGIQDKTNSKGFVFVVRWDIFVQIAQCSAILTPIRRVFLDVKSQPPSECAAKSFGLTICLRMLCCCERVLNHCHLANALEEERLELEADIGHNRNRWTVFDDPFIDERRSNCKSPYFAQRDCLCELRDASHNDKDEAVRRLALRMPSENRFPPCPALRLGETVALVSLA